MLSYYWSCESNGLTNLLWNELTDFFRYICSRIFLHNPPGDDNALQSHPDAPLALKHEEKKLLEEDPEVSQWVCIGMLCITIALMAVTAEWVSHIARPDLFDSLILT